MITICWHIPGFIDEDPPEPVQVADWEAAKELTSIASWLATGVTFSVSRGKTEKLLMARVPHTGKSYVVGYLTGDFPELPEWPKPNTVPS